MGKEGGRVAAMCRKACFPALNGVRQYMRAGRPYVMSHGGNVAAGRHAKPPTSKAAHRRPLRATTPFKTVAFAFLFPLFVPRSGNKREADL